MATTSPDNIWTPDSGDDYALTVDLAATADTIQDALTALRAELNAQPLVQRGTMTFSGGGSPVNETSITFPSPFGDTPSVSIDGYVLTNGDSLIATALTRSPTGFTGRLVLTGAGGNFSSTYTLSWIAVGARP